MSKSNRVFAQKGVMRTAFSAMVWKNMGTNKNGWREITAAQYHGGKNPDVSRGDKPTVLVNEENYKKVYEQGKGFEKDGNLEDALARYQQALSMKSTPALKGKITKLVKQIAEISEKAEAEHVAANRKELISLGDSQMVEKSFDGALEAYKEAQAMGDDDAIKAKIAEAIQAEEDSLAN